MPTCAKPITAPDEPRCDEHSLFDAEGFPLPLPGSETPRQWFPWAYGGQCEHPGCRKPI
jgi:hypothetical protein